MEKQIAPATTEAIGDFKNHEQVFGTPIPNGTQLASQNIPLELQALPQWVCWRLEWKRGDVRHELKPTKIPYAPNGRFASVTDPATWASFGGVLSCAPFNCIKPCDFGTPTSQTGFTGIGFVFTKSDPFCGIDLDDCHGDAEAYARQIKIFQAFGSYSELSPSGHGLHIICKAALPGPGRRRSFVELYDAERYFTFTGNVHHAAPIIERQELAKLLYDEMGGPAKTFIYGDDQQEKNSDENICNMAAAAANGDKFTSLFNGNWNSNYASQSEADFALVDIIAFYTQNRAQIARIFRKSSLGQRDKANRSAYIGYMVEKSFDRQLPPVDTEGLTIAFQKLMLERAAGETGTSKPASPARDAPAGENEAAVTRSQPPADASTVFPPGLVGEIAQFIHDAAPMPVREISLVAATGFIAGICGRAYNVSGAGLNVYVLLIARTGLGKEAIASGISKLEAAIKANSPTILDYKGPAEIASPQGLIKWLARTPCVYSIVGEFGLKLREMSMPHASSHISGLKRMLLDLYHKSGKGSFMGAMAYSNREDNTSVIESPSFTLIGESTPERFFENVTDDVVTDGLLPRFMVKEYDGQRQKLNKSHNKAPPPAALVSKLTDLVAYCSALSTKHEVQSVSMDKAAAAIFDSFEDYIIEQMNCNLGIAVDLWNRAHLKAMKLAALFAVGENLYNPMISGEQANAACNEIKSQTTTLLARFSKGEVGSVGGNEERQYNAVVKLIAFYTTSSYEQCKPYLVPEEMHRAKIVPASFIQRRLIATAAFKGLGGGTAAINRCLQRMISSDEIQQIPKDQMAKQFGTSATAYSIVRAELFLDAL